MLYDVVDYFVVTESDLTFSGKSKSLIFGQNLDRFRKYFDKIIYNPVTTNDLKNIKQKFKSNYLTDFNKSTPHKSKGIPAKKLHRTLRREILQRDSAILGFYNRADEKDLILLSDVDEIPNPKIIEILKEKNLNSPHYFEMKWYMYFINNKVCDPWFGTVAFNFEILKEKSLDLLRYSSKDKKNIPGEMVQEGGWHFSYLGGEKAILEKLRAHPYQGKKAQISMLLNKLGIRTLKKTINVNKDILLQNRKFEIVPIDETFPNLIRNNKYLIEKYSMLG